MNDIVGAVIASYWVLGTKHMHLVASQARSALNPNPETLTISALRDQDWSG
jgi:hypothetical protein